MTDVQPHDETGLSRRQALKAGAVGGAVLWTVPVAQVLGTGVAEAVSGGTTTPGDGSGGGGGSTPNAQYPSNGLILLRNAAGALFAVQVLPSTSFADAGKGAAEDYLTSLGHTDVSYTGFGSFAGFSASLSSDATGRGSITVTSIAAGYTVVLTAVKDGGYTANGTSLVFTKVKGL